MSELRQPDHSENEAILREEIAQLSSHIETLERDLDGARVEREKLQGEVDRLMGLLNTRAAIQEDETRRWQNVAKAKEEDAKRLQLKVQDLEQQIETEAVEYAELTVLLSEQQADAETALNAAVDANAELDTVRGELDERNAQLEVLAADVEEAKQAAKEVVESFESERRTITEALRSSHNLRLQLEAHLEKANERISKLSAQLRAAVVEINREGCEEDTKVIDLTPS